MICRTYISIILLLTAFTLAGQDVSFSSLTSEDGISQSEVYCFLHDSKGYMWFGTLDGLNRFDGYSIETFNMNKDDPNSLIHNTVYSIVEDKNGRIWIGTGEGLNVFDPETEQMFAIPNFFSGKLLIIRALLAEGNNLWIGTQQGLFRMTLFKKKLDERVLDISSQKINHVDIEINGVPSIYSSVGSIVKTADKNIWIGTWEGLCKFDYSTERSEYYNYKRLPAKISEISKINSIIEDANNELWIGTQSDGIFIYQTEKESLMSISKETLKGFPSNNIKTMIPDHKGDVWVGTFKDGLVRIKGTSIGQSEFFYDRYQNNEFKPGSINSNLIRSLYVSRDGLLWIGTLGSGINILNPSQKNFGLRRIPPDAESGRVNNFIRAIYPDGEGNLWLGLHNDGLVKYNREADTYVKMGMEEFFTIFDIYPVNKNYLWVATSSGAHLLRLNEQSVTIIASVNFNEASDVMAYNACFNILETEPGIFWIASMSGIARVELKRDFELEVSYLNSGLELDIPMDNIRVLEYDNSANVLWAGSEGGGLHQIYLDDDNKPLKISNFKSIADDSLSMSSNYIRTLCFDSNMNLWVGSYEGLNMLTFDTLRNVQKIQTWKTDNGLPNNMIQSIEDDENGNLWIGTNGGLSKFILDENKFINYKITDGLQSNEFSEHASYIDAEKTLYFGGISGFNVFIPEQIRPDPIKPNVKLTEFFLNNKLVEVNKKLNNHILLDKAIGQTDSLKLRSRENDIRFGFSAFYYTDPGKIKYLYKLDGYDEDWVPTDANQRIANYTNLPFGKYVFMVKASNSEGTMYFEPTTIYLHIKTPYGLRWWAMLIYLAIFVASGLYFTRYSIIRIATKEKMILENEHNQALHELDMLRTRFFINISHDLRTPLTLITGPLAKILKNIEKSEIRSQLELVNRNAIRLRYLVEQLLDIRKVETGKLKARPVRIDLLELIQNEAAHFELALKEKGLSFRILMREEEIITMADHGMVEKVIFNLLSNALKYTEQGEILVNLSRIKHEEMAVLWPDCMMADYIKVDIQDSGKGMSAGKEEKVFERFYQDPDNKGKGYGIGLSHCRDLVKAQNGYITVKSTVGFGTTFSVYLPHIIPENQNTSTFIEKGSDITGEFPEVVADYTPKENVQNEDFQTILIVDDNPDLRSYLRSGLENSYNIFEAVNGEEGLLKAGKIYPEMIISDIMMPKMDGVEFCKRIKSDIQTSHIPVILLTARTDMETKLKGIETGADDYISKPFDMDYVCMRVKNILKTREHLKNLFRKNSELEPSVVTVSSPDELFLKKLMRIIEQGIPESDFSVDSLEQGMGMSHTNFYRKVKSITGQSGKELLQNVRLKRAVQLLTQNKIRISEIAYMTGFSNPKYFSKCFKEKYGVRPSEYLKNETN
ncbi:two-component regulator propeller domain-containing protein [Bacteroidota bacterium]